MTNNITLSILHTNIYSLEGNAEKLETFWLVVTINIPRNLHMMLFWKKNQKIKKSIKLKDPKNYWTCSINKNKFHFCQNCDLRTSSCILLHQPYDWRCNPDLIEKIINKRIFLHLTGSSIDIWCNIQKIFQFVSQKFLWYNCNRKLYCPSDTIYNWLKTTKKFRITFNNMIV